MRLAKIIALIVASAFLAGISYSAFPTGWCGNGPLRSFTIPGTGGKLQIAEPQGGEATQICIGASRIDVPVSPTWTVISFVALAASLAGFAPIRRSGLRLVCLAILGTVFTGFAAYFAIETTTLLGFLSEPLPPNVMLAPWEPAKTLLLLLLTMIAAIISWLASFRIGKQFVNPDITARDCAGAPDCCLAA